ncbi:hypothetical protein NDU88_004247 [Pleurodeles waltl]|uniref:Uncharacterized protein n=1 Tax=Pleurodeles waltl TaxID=8319 RepID=A0AAV7UFJ7_PLEWA|nr:hypothetical protein NDU88_004247 [Pleurodeles waltl]
MPTAPPAYHASGMYPNITPPLDLSPTSNIKAAAGFTDIPDDPSPPQTYDTKNKMQVQQSFSDSGPGTEAVASGLPGQIDAQFTLKLTPTLINVISQHDEDEECCDNASDISQAASHTMLRSGSNVSFGENQPPLSDQPHNLHGQVRSTSAPPLSEEGAQVLAPQQLWNCDEEFPDHLIPLDSSKWRCMDELRSGVQNLTYDDINISEFKIQTPSPRDDGAAALRRMSQTLENLKDSLNEMIGGAGSLSNKKKAREDTPPQAQRFLYRIEIRDSEVIPQNYDPSP